MIQIASAALACMSLAIEGSARLAMEPSMTAMVTPNTTVMIARMRCSWGKPSASTLRFGKAAGTGSSLSWCRRPKHRAWPQIGAYGITALAALQCALSAHNERDLLRLSGYDADRLNPEATLLLQGSDYFVRTVYFDITACQNVPECRVAVSQKTMHYSQDVSR